MNLQTSRIGNSDPLLGSANLSDHQSPQAQAFLDLLDNVSEATIAQAPISWRFVDDPWDRQVLNVIHNWGGPIPRQLLSNWELAAAIGSRCNASQFTKVLCHLTLTAKATF
jgi:hypothetical protein